MRVQIVASKPHYIDHLLPVWWALSKEERAVFTVPTVLEPYLRSLGVEPGPPERTDVTLGASWPDVNGARGSKKVLMEHGVGQTYLYSTMNPHYAGAPGRSSVDLFLAPNERVLKLNKRATPNSEHVMIGSPRMDVWFTMKLPDPEDIVVFSFHWRCKVCRESNTALDNFKGMIFPQYGPLQTHYHSHPSIMNEVMSLARKEEVPYIERFSEVAYRAQVYACDNSSTLFEFAALGKPVIVLNTPSYRRSVSHGLRFWEFSDVGVNAEDPTELPRAIERALSDPTKISTRREEISAKLFPYQDGSCAKRAAEAIRELSVV